MGDFLMPSLGADMEVGTVLEWRVAVGDEVHRGDIIAVVDTDKSDIEVEVFEDGIVDELLVDTGHDVAVGTPLARIRPVGAELVSTAPCPESELAAAPSPAAARPDAMRLESLPPPVLTPTRLAPRPGVRASPWARRRADSLGIDLTTVLGSGPEGAIAARDVEHAARTSVPQPAADDERTRRAAMRRAIGELMARSKREIPHYHVSSTIDLEPALTWLGEWNERRSVGDRILPAALLLAATARAAAQCPSMNGTWDDGFRAAGTVDLGVAIALRGGGLATPTIRGADHLPIDQLMAALADVVARARSGRLRTSDVAAGTITVTNLGERGAEEVHGIIFPPQVALVGFGRVVERPTVVDGLVVVRRTVRVTVAADHRVSDGHDGSRMLDTIDHVLQGPEVLT